VRTARPAVGFSDHFDGLVHQLLRHRLPQPAGRRPDVRQGRQPAADRVQAADSSNETEADPLLGGFFIGDYIEAFTHANRVWVHWNGNYRRVPLLGAFRNPETGEPFFPGVPVNQQDNYLTVTGPG
jgi:hypothetical protein